MHQKRLKANRLHNKKRHEEAIHCYMEVLVAGESLAADAVKHSPSLIITEKSKIEERYIDPEYAQLSRISERGL